MLDRPRAEYRAEQAPNSRSGVGLRLGRCVVTISGGEPLTGAERTIMLRALFELAVTASAFDDDPERYDRADHMIRPEQIAELVRKLGGNPDVPLFGADDLRD